MVVFTHDVLRKHLLESAGVFASVTVPDLDELRQTEWSSDFERLMRNRLVIGALRYGRLGAKGKPKWNRREAIVQRVAEYEATGNLELLVDVANLCLLEFVEGDHPARHWQATDERKHVCCS